MRIHRLSIGGRLAVVPAAMLIASLVNSVMAATQYLSSEEAVHAMLNKQLETERLASLTGVENRAIWVFAVSAAMALFLAALLAIYLRRSIAPPWSMYTSLPMKPRPGKVSPTFRRTTC